MKYDWIGAWNIYGHAWNGDWIKIESEVEILSSHLEIENETEIKQNQPVESSCGLFQYKDNHVGKYNGIY